MRKDKDQRNQKQHFPEQCQKDGCFRISKGNKSLLAGELDGKEVVVSIGRYGPYIRYDGKFTSLPRKDDPYSVTLERAVELIHEKESAAKASKEPIKVFDAEPEIKVLNGRYGPYIASGGKNYRIPKDTDPATLTLEQVRDIMAKSKK